MDNRDLSLVMTFKNEDGKDTVVTLKQIKPDITDEEVKAAMDLIISTNLFVSTGGDLVSKVKAQIIDKTVDELEIA